MMRDDTRAVAPSCLLHDHLKYVISDEGGRSLGHPQSKAWNKSLLSADYYDHHRHWLAALKAFPVDVECFRLWLKAPKPRYGA